MSYLIYNDYKKAIQQINLTQVLGGDLSILESWQLAAQEKAVSYLTQKYDVSMEFTNTRQWDPTKIYNAADRVYLNAPLYVPATSYSINDLAMNNGNIYLCSAVTTGVFDPTKWTLLGAQYDMYYAGYPVQFFNVNTFYKKGDQVFWQGKIYTAQQDSGNPAINNIQYISYKYIPAMNYFPGDDNNSSQWGTGTSFTIAAGTPLTDPKWINGDNRSQQLVETVSDIVIFRIHQRISPQNIPINRHENYKMAIQWLIDAGEGVVTPNLPRRQPNQGNRIRWGGNIKNVNSY